MSFSTPQSAGSKSSASSGSVFVSPGTRRQPLSGSSTPVLQNCPQNDDERERKQRRRSRVFDLQFSTESPLSIQSPISKTTCSMKVHKMFDISLDCGNCEKITTKNVFGLHLIDYMTEILKQKDSELTNFKVAAGTLDASAKIYAVKVDAVHADVYRVLGGLGRDAAPVETENNQDSDGEKEDLDHSKKCSIKRKHLYKTIEQNLNNINVSETERKCESDPMFQKTASSFDECSTAGVFLTTLHTHSYLSEVLFDSMVVPLPSSSGTSEIPSSSPVKVTDLKSILLRCVENSAICPSLSGFLFTQWDSETHNESVSALLDKFKKSDQVFDINAETDKESLEDRMEDDFDADVLDKTMARDLGEFSEKLDACEIAPECSRENQVSVREGDIGSMCLQLSMNPSEYSYFSPRIMSMWAGPEHWRFKPHHKGTVGRVEDVSDISGFLKQASTVLSKSTLQSQNKKSNTLPTDFHYDPDNLTQLFLKPQIRLSNMVLEGCSPNHGDDDDEIGEYDFSNPNDTFNFCPAVQDGDSDDDNEPVHFIGQGGMFEMTANPTSGDYQDGELDGKVKGFNISTYGEANMVAEPQKASITLECIVPKFPIIRVSRRLYEIAILWKAGLQVCLGIIMTVLTLPNFGFQVNKIDIQYAKTAKKMDMKRLKQCMWHLLTEVSKNQTEEEVCIRKPGFIVVLVFSFRIIVDFL
ncbi:Condensin complex subunit 2 [Ophiophagus hannah]|uniref:Condensin complex subunit 2 n=1 Tax=Ophiophagus hannah TaxID=8665 RepID=V8NG82_OPHHA|nr:Condensin complex subunit 2 [Ophiophagus hannah]